MLFFLHLDVRTQLIECAAAEDSDETPTAPVAKPSVRIYERTRTGEDTIVKRNITVDDQPAHEKERRRFIITRASTLEVVRRDSFLDARKPRRWISFHNFNLMTTLVDGFKDAAETAMAVLRVPRCASPESLLPCEGWCKPTTRRMKAQVVSDRGHPCSVLSLTSSPL